MSKYENNVFPYYLHSTVNLLALHGGRKTQCYSNVFLRLFTETNVVKIDEIREELSTSHFVT